MELLKEAIEEHANPYACWVYARLLRPELLQDFPTANGRQAWYEKYLGLMVFAANMGVTGAADDLLAEATAGRADGLLITIAALTGRRYKQAARLQLTLTLPSIEDSHTMGALQNYEGEPNHDNWRAHLHKSLKNIPETTDITHSIRMFWLSNLIYSFAPHSGTASSTTQMHVYTKDLKLPRELEISIVTALEYFPAIPLTECKSAIRAGFSPPR